MKYTYSGRPMKGQEIEDSLPDLPRAKSDWSAKHDVIRNWFFVGLLVCVIGIGLWIGFTWPGTT